MRVWKLIRIVGVLLFVSALASSGVSAPARKGTVVTRTGYVYDSVTYVIDTAGRQITITSPPIGTIGFAEIQTLYDEYGRKIARDSWASLDQPADSSDMAGGGRPRRQRPHERPTVYFRISPTWSSTGGDYYYSGVDPGIGYSVGLSLRISGDLALRFDYSRAGFSSVAFASHHNIWEKVYAEGRLKLNALRYTMSLEYTRIMNLNAPKLRMYYLYAGFGTIDHTYRADALRYRWHGWRADGSLQYSESYLVTVAGVGARVMVSDHLGVDAGGAVHVVFLGRYAAKTGDPPEHHFATNIDGWVGLVVVF